MILNNAVDVIVVIIVTSAAVLAGAIVGIRACAQTKSVRDNLKPEPTSPPPTCAAQKAPCPIGCDLEVTGVALSDDGELTEVLCKTCNKCYEFRHKQPSTEKPV